jgi:CrcB protein
MDDVPAATPLGEAAPDEAARAEAARGEAAPVRTGALGPLVRDRLVLLTTIAAGGAVGSLARWGLGLALSPWTATTPAIPWGTFTANITGCLLLGALTVVLAERHPTSRHQRPFLGVGVLGGYTTFSTLMLEARGLLVSGRGGAALLYVAASVVVGLAAVVTGMQLARSLPSSRAAGTS